MSRKISAEKYINKTFVLQQDQTDCGIASLLSIIRFYGSDQTLEKLRELSGTHVTGTTLLGLYQCAQSIGFDAKGTKINFEFLKAQVSPCILHVLIENRLEHYVVYYGKKQHTTTIEKDVYLIGDPRKGLVEIHEDELDEIWKSKIALLVQPNLNFKPGKSTLNSKWQWFKDVIDDDINILVITILLGFFITVLGVSTAVFYQKMIDDILPHAKISKLVAGISLLFFILVGKSFLTYLRQHFILMQSKSFNERITGNFLNALFYLPKSFFDKRKTGDMTARLNDTQRIQKNIAYIAGTVCIDILITIVTLIILFIYSTPIALVTLCFIPVIVFTVLNFVKPIHKQQKNVMIAYGSTESSYVDHINGISTIKENNSEGVFISTNKAIFRHFQEASIALGNIGNKFNLASELLGVFMLISMVMVSSYLVINKQIKIGEMVAVLSMIGSLLPSVHRLAQSNLQIQEAKVAFDRMHEFASVKPEFELQENELMHLNLEQLVVQDMAFGFPGRKLIIQNVSFEVRKGELIVLVGESGCGKSTILQLLQRFYYPAKGNIFVNNRPIAELYIPSWRDIIATVPQDVKLFNTTLAENITMGRKIDSITEVHHFCEKYGFDKYFSAFPQGYLTIVGEEGINLSGGQKQLVAMARALFKKPQLLLLDEATAAMDKNTEQFIFSLLKKLSDEIAVIMVTHRINTVKNADRIYIIEDGIVVDKGTHTSLMLTNNLYSNTLAEYSM